MSTTSAPSWALGFLARRHLAALDLLVDHPQQVVAIRVAVLFGTPLTDHRADQLLGHLQLLVGDGEFVQILAGQVEVGRFAQLVGPAEGIGEDDRAVGQDRAEVLALPDDDLGHADLARPPDGLAQKGVGPPPRLGRLGVVRGVVVGDVDLGAVDELHDVDALRGLDVGPLEIGGLQDHVAVPLVLVTLDDVLERDLVPFFVHALVVHSPEILPVEHVESDVLPGVFSRVERDRDRHQAETDSSLPERASHEPSPPGTNRLPGHLPQAALALEFPVREGKKHPGAARLFRLAAPAPKISALLGAPAARGARRTKQHGRLPGKKPPLSLARKARPSPSVLGGLAGP